MKPMDFTNSKDTKLLDDASLIKLLTLQQSDALGALYDRYGRLMYSIALYSVEDQGSAEEIVQDVFTQVWAKARTYDAGIAKVRTWLICITRNRAIDELRKRKAHPEKTSLSLEDVPQIYGPYTQGPEEEMELSSRQTYIRNALKTLAPNQRAILALAYFHGYSQSQIARALNIPLGTVKTRIRIAIQKLRRVISQTTMGN